MEAGVLGLGEQRRRDEGVRTHGTRPTAVEEEVKCLSHAPGFLACVPRRLVVPLPGQRPWGKVQVRSKGDDSV